MQYIFRRLLKSCLQKATVEFMLSCVQIDFNAVQVQQQKFQVALLGMI